MSANGFKRRLLSILSADVVGYSRVMFEDDEATVKPLIGHHGMMSAIIEQHQGRVVNFPGDTQEVKVTI